MIRPSTIVTVLVLVLQPGSPVVAQERPPVPERAPPRTSNPPTPGGAMLRAILLPGWGHASIGAHTRGGFYFAAEMGTAYMILLSRGRRGEAQERVALRERVLRATLEAEGITDPSEIEVRLGDDPGVADARRRVDARADQQEDWVALGLFLLLLSGADALVSAHLADFPNPLVETASLGTGAIEVGLRVFLPW